MDIQDIPLYEAKQFLQINKIRSDGNKIYDDVLKLMKNSKTSYDNVPDNIILWMRANNFIKNGKTLHVQKYLISDIINLPENELSELSVLLGLKSVNLKYIIGVLSFLRKLDSRELIVNTEKLTQLSSEYKHKLYMDIVERELKHVNKNIKKVNKINQYTGGQSEVYALKPGDRVYSLSFVIKNVSVEINYIITSVEDLSAKVKHVDILGNILEENEEDIEVNINQHDLLFHNLLHWSFKTYKKDMPRIIPGILKFDNGPKIKNIDSVYLKYKSLPNGIFGDPELNMTVNVSSEWKKYRHEYDEYEPMYDYLLYVITDLSDDHMILTLVASDNKKKYLPELEVVKAQDNKWKITTDKNYEILKIGGWQI